MSKSPSINRDLVVHVAAHVLSSQLAARRDPVAAANDDLDRLADLSVRAAIALDAAIPRAEERIAAEAKAAEEAAAAAAAAEKAQAEAAEKAAAEAAATAKAEAKAEAKAAPKK